MLDVVMALAESDCEALRTGWLAQPANALSSGAFVAVGVGLAALARRHGTRRRALGAGALAMVAAGAASVAYHGPQPGWAGAAHDLSVAAVAAVVAAQTTRLLARTSTRAVALAAWRSALPWALAAAAAWAAGRAGAPLCRPETLLQPHAAWHGLSALGLGVLLGRLAVPASAASVPSAVRESVIRP